MLIQKKKGGLIMETNSQAVLQVSVPEVDINFLKQLAKRMGWSIERKKGIDLGLEDLKARRTRCAKSADDMFKQILDNEEHEV